MTHPPDPLADLRSGFFVECGDLLERLQDALTEMEAAAADAAPTDPEVVNTAFRAVHSIKGGAGAFGLTALVGFAHRVETVFDALRDGAIRARAEDVALLIRSADHLVDLVSAVAAGAETPAPAAGIEAALAALVPVAPAEAGPGAAEDPGDSRPWRVAFCPQAALFASGNEPLFLLQALADLGATDIRCDTTALPHLAALDPEDSYLGWHLTLPATRRGIEIGAVFDFVEDVCDLTMERLAPAPSTAAPGAVVETPSIRVDLDRVDRLMNLVGELAINQSILTQSLSEAGLDAHSALAARLETLTGLTRDIQDSVMTMRAQPVKPLFQRMGRVLRETAAALGKPARLKLEGEATEVDRTVIERLADPLMHMIRNALDHGIEPAEERRRAGKPEEGTITLTAAHRAGRLVVELGDDGRGLDRARIRAVAEKRGLIARDAPLGEAETDLLLFRPGFSTAGGVTDISGRGVGMDVVKTAITRLGGRIAIRSEPGRGTTFSLSLPLTLAVMDGMVVRAAGQMFVVPVAAILETAKLAALDRRSFGAEGALVRLRGAFAPLCDVASALGMRAAGQTGAEAIAILTVAEDGSRTALVVDAILDQRQIVVKPLRGGFGRMLGISAATILGDGRIALILDPGELARLPGGAGAAQGPDREVA